MPEEGAVEETPVATGVLGAADAPAAARRYDAVLGPSELLPDRPFTDPKLTHVDALIMADMLGRERALARAWLAGTGGFPAGIARRIEISPRQLLSVPDSQALCDARDVTAVGFFGHLRDGVDHDVLFELERRVSETFPSFARYGLLSYFDLGLEHGRYGNLIVFGTPDVPREWHANPAHGAAIAAAPLHYEWVRLHKGRIDGPFLDGDKLRLARTLYLDFSGQSTWHAVRHYEAGAGRAEPRHR